MLHLAFRRLKVRNVQFPSTRVVCKMSSKADTDSSTNTSGPKSGQSQSLQERPTKSQDEAICEPIRQTFSFSPTNGAYTFYVCEAVSHGRAGIPGGEDSVQPLFEAGTAKILSRADISKFRIVQKPTTAPQSIILIDQDIAYYISIESGSAVTVVNTAFTLKLIGEKKAFIRNEEYDYQKTTTNEDSFLGMLNKQRKKITTALIDAFVRGKNKNQSD